MTKAKVSYEVDPHNRLVIKSPPRKSNVKKFRKVVSGRFKTDKRNKLYYEVFKASESKVPQKIKFSGKYLFDKKHNLVYVLDKWKISARAIGLGLRQRSWTRIKMR